MRIDALVLAAGASSRLGQPKQAVRIHDNALLTRAVSAAGKATAGRVHVVLGAGAGTLGALAAAAQVHVFEDWAQGQHASLCFGLDRVGDVDAVLVMPCDQYRVRAEQLIALVSLWRSRPDAPAAASYDGTLGVPVVWPAAWFSRLRRAGRGRALLNARMCSALPLPEAAYDLDTPADLAALTRWIGPPDG